MVWNKLRYFSKSEKWGDPYKMNGALLLILDEIRHMAGLPVVIHCGYESTGHTENSKHYTGDAVDFHIVGCSLFDAYIIITETLTALQMIGRVGLGVYPEWNNKGFHLDIRNKKARWSKTGGEYRKLEKAF